MSAFSFTIMPFGENGWLAVLSGGDMVDRAIAANAAADAFRTLPGITDAVAGVESLVIRFLPSAIAAKDVEAELERALKTARTQPAKPGPIIEIPVCYGGEHGPDFDTLSGKLGMSGEDLIALHSAQTYRVLTVGFAPGFAYLGPLPQQLQTSRLATPRIRVPAGSVGVAGAMTGVYALSSPGGWPLIGRTPKKLFDAQSEAPFLFSPGAAVHFVAIDEDAFAGLEAEQP